MITLNSEDKLSFVVTNYNCGSNTIILGEYHKQNLGYCFNVITQKKKSIDITIYEY